MSTFQTNPIKLEDLLKWSEKGEIKLPDFQRGWVWDEERIKSLLSSVSMAFPIGALMTLNTGGTAKFKHRKVEGTPTSADITEASALILDGQQRITSLYQSCLRQESVQTKTPRNKRVYRWFYIDMKNALDGKLDESIVGVPEDRIVRTNFGRDIVLDLSTPDKEYEQHMFRMNRVFDYMRWQGDFVRYWKFSKEATELATDFFDRVITNIATYSVPVITLGKETPLGAICLVFEKVNTGGKPLDTFELVTAMYAGHGFDLREDWLGTTDKPGRRKQLREFNRILHGVSSTDFLQVISLLHTNQLWRDAKARGAHDLPTVTTTRQSLLELPLDGYKEHADSAQSGLEEAAKFLHALNIFRSNDLPYRTQLVPLAAILAALGSRAEDKPVRDKLAEWYWNGVFGELYGSATESRAANDMVGVIAWIEGGKPPDTVTRALFRADRLDSLRTRRSAAYKGLNALLMTKRARDFRSGQRYVDTVFFGDRVDIHHIFPRHWCREHSVEAARFESIVNKTPLSWRTNRILAGDAPSRYLERLERGATQTQPIPTGDIDAHLESHLINPTLLRADDFDRFYVDRKLALCRLVEKAMKKDAFWGQETDEPEEEAPDEEVE